MTTLDHPSVLERAPVRRPVAVLLTLHGIAHFVGAQAAVRAASSGDPLTYLYDLWQLSGPALAAMAVAWTVAGLAFAAVAVLLWRRSQRWWPALVAVAGASLVLSLLAMPEAFVGVAIDVLLLVGAFLGRR